jgi:hypothetical protein
LHIKPEGTDLQGSVLFRSACAVDDDFDAAVAASASG